MRRTVKKKEHYVNNAEFLAAIVKYKDKVTIAEEKGLPKPRVNNYIGGCFLIALRSYFLIRFLLFY